MLPWGITCFINLEKWPTLDTLQKIKLVGRNAYLQQQIKGLNYPSKVDLSCTGSHDLNQP
jgi:hypothetical protein